LIEQAHRAGEALGLAVWNQDEAGPYQTVPHPGASWQPEGDPGHRPHEYVPPTPAGRPCTAKLLTLFHPATGEVRVKGVTSTTNVTLHGWLKEELDAILATSPEPAPRDQETTRALWEAWRVGFTARVTLPAELPPLRLLLIFDNLVGHTSADLLCWLFAHGIMPLYTPLGGSWLNMAESIQRILKHRALDGQYPKNPQEIIDALEATACAWNRDPTPFVWGGKRAARRQRARERRHAQGGSGAVTTRPIRRCRAKARYGSSRAK